MSRRSSRRAARREGADADKPDRDPPRHTPQDRRGGLALWRAIREISPKGRKEYEPTDRHREYVNLNCTLCTRLGIWWGYMIFPIDAERPEPPEHMRQNSLLAETWRRAHRWRGLLMEAEARS
jgi:hypothetical protein